MSVTLVFADEDDKSIRFDAEVDAAGNMHLKANGLDVLTIDRSNGQGTLGVLPPELGLALDGSGKLLLT